MSKPAALDVGNFSTWGSHQICRSAGFIWADLCALLAFLPRASVGGEVETSMATASATEHAKVTVRIDPVTRKRLVAEAAAQRRTLSNLAKLLLEDALAQADALERAR
jgi:hypothetical protein